jgi:hypothetical protein
VVERRRNRLSPSARQVKQPLTGQTQAGFLVLDPSNAFTKVIWRLSCGDARRDPTLCWLLAGIVTFRIGGQQDDHTVCQRFVQKAKTCEWRNPVCLYTSQSSRCCEAFWRSTIYTHNHQSPVMCGSQARANDGRSAGERGVQDRPGQGGGVPALHRGGHRRLHPQRGAEEL